MCRFVVIALLAYLLAAAHTHKNACPQNCKCDLQSKIMSCKSLELEKETVKSPFAHFELVKSDGPISLKNRTFANIGLHHVNSITISNTSIKSMESSAFEGLEELEDLNIAHSNVSYIHPKTFEQNKQLRKLVLTGNPLGEKSLQFSSDSVVELIFKSCNLTVIPSETFQNMKKLTYLDLSDNSIEKIEKGVFDPLIDIKEIRLENNKISEFSDDIFHEDVEVETINLSNNPLTSFSGKRLTNLGYLYLKSGLLTTIDAETFAGMTDLITLDLSDNKIVKIDQNAFSDLSLLETLNLSNNRLEELDSSVFQNCDHLTNLILDGNKFQKFFEPFQLNMLPSDIQRFSCSHCGLRSIPEDFFTRSMSTITIINLSHNKISDISTKIFQKLYSLVQLDLSHNQIGTIANITFKDNINLNTLLLTNNPLKLLHSTVFKNNNLLQYLDISNSGLVKLWSDSDIEKASTLSSIVQLNISNNHINLLKVEDVQITNNLKSLDLSNNPLRCGKSTHQLVKYLINKEIKITEYRTMANLGYEMESTDLDAYDWKKVMKKICPDGADGEEYDYEDYEEDTETDEYSSTDKENVDEALDIDIDNIQSKMNYVLPATEYDTYMAMETIHHQRAQYSFLWPSLIFIGTALAILGIAANIILFVLRKHPSLPRINIRPASAKLKKNSGLVYQQLSEERGGPKTPILNRLPLPTVHSKVPNGPENV